MGTSLLASATFGAYGNTYVPRIKDVLNCTNETYECIITRPHWRHFHGLCIACKCCAIKWKFPVFFSWLSWSIQMENSETSSVGCCWSRAVGVEKSVSQLTNELYMNRYIMHMCISRMFIRAFVFGRGLLMEICWCAENHNVMTAHCVATVWNIIKVLW